MGITEKLKKTTDAFESLSSDSRSTFVGFEADKLKEIRSGQSGGVSVRAVMNGRIGFSYSTNMSDLDEVAENAKTLAAFGKVSRHDFAPKADANTELAYDASCENLDVEELIGHCVAMRDELKNLAPDARVDCGVGGGVAESRLITSAGQDCSERGSQASAYAVATFNDEGNFLTTYRSVSNTRAYGREGLLQVARDTAQLFNESREVVDFKSSSVPVLFSPEALTDILMPITTCVNGRHIEQKTSPFVDALGETRFDERVTLIDDPHLEGSPSSSLFDGEGLPTARRALVENGTLKGFVHTLDTATACGHEPTANGQRGIKSQPTPSIHNLTMNPGEDSLSDLRQRASGGLLIRSLLGTFTSNFLAGQVSGNIAMGLVMNDGQPKGRIKNCALNVNVFDLLKGSIVGISKERRMVGNQLLPWVLFKDVAIAAR